MKTKLIILAISFFCISSISAQQKTKISFDLGSAIDFSKPHYLSNDILAMNQRGIVIYGVSFEKQITEMISFSFEPTKINRLLQFKVFNTSFSNFKIGYLSLPVMVNYTVAKFTQNQDLKLKIGAGFSSNIQMSKELDRKLKTNNKDYSSHFKIDYNSNLVHGFIAKIELEKEINEKKAVGISFSYVNIFKTFILEEASFEHTLSNVTSSFNQSLTEYSRTNLLQIKLKYYYNL